MKLRNKNGKVIDVPVDHAEQVLLRQGQWKKVEEVVDKTVTGKSSSGISLLVEEKPKQRGRPKKGA